MESLKPKCCSCHYFAFPGLLKACAHPDNVKVLQGGPVKCKFYEDHESKCLPSQKKWWKERVSIKELLEILCK